MIFHKHINNIKCRTKQIQRTHEIIKITDSAIIISYLDLATCSHIRRYILIIFQKNFIFQTVFRPIQIFDYSFSIHVQNRRF